MISVHPESTHHLSRSLKLIRSNGCEAGIVLNPGTPITYLDWIMEEIDFILVMSVNPGFGVKVYSRFGRKNKNIREKLMFFKKS